MTLNRIALLLALSATLVAPHGVLAETKTKKTTKAVISGEVVDLACYLQDSKKRGELHETCAREGINAGNPVGIITQGGILYLVLGRDLRPVNELLAPYAGKWVKATGKRCSQAGMKGFIIEKVEEIPPPKTRSKSRSR